MIKELYEIKDNKIVKCEISYQTKTYISIKWTYQKYHKIKDARFIDMHYFRSYDEALNWLIKSVIDKKEEINKINNEINEIFSMYILNEKDRKKFKWLLY